MGNYNERLPVVKKQVICLFLQERWIHQAIYICFTRQKDTLSLRRADAAQHAISNDTN